MGQFSGEYEGAHLASCERYVFYQLLNFLISYTIYSIAINLPEKIFQNLFGGEL